MAADRPFGYFWFLGPYEKPELTTFGDGLHHLETLLVDLSFGAGKRPSCLLGCGEGGVMALMLAAVWPELVSAVVSIDGPLPVNIGSFPVEICTPLKVPTLLIEHERPMADTASALADLGAKVERRQVDDQPLREALDWLKWRLGGAEARPVVSASHAH
jgi:hypothetical protein